MSLTWLGPVRGGGHQNGKKFLCISGRIRPFRNYKKNMCQCDISIWDGHEVYEYNNSLYNIVHTTHLYMYNSGILTRMLATIEKFVSAKEICAMEQLDGSLEHFFSTSVLFSSCFFVETIHFNHIRPGQSCTSSILSFKKSTKNK